MICPCCRQHAPDNVKVLINKNTVSTISGTVILSSRQAILMHVLVDRHLQIATYDHIISAIWGNRAEGGILTARNCIGQYVHHTNKIIGSIGLHIENDKDVGYHLNFVALTKKGVSSDGTEVREYGGRYQMRRPCFLRGGRKNA